EHDSARSGGLKSGGKMLSAIAGAALALSVAVHAEDIAVKTSVTKALRAGNAITAVWANTGEDKVTQDELRGTRGTASLVNSAWTGNQVSLFGAKNEVVAFDLILEAANTTASNVTVQFDTLTGPNGAQIKSVPTAAGGVFNWGHRDIEIFYVRYLDIKGVSVLSYGTYDERHIPQKLQRPKAANGSYTGGWTARPNHDKAYPDIAVPMELVPNFSITAG